MDLAVEPGGFEAAVQTKTTLWRLTAREYVHTGVWL